jgi:cytochrome P450
MPLTLQRPPGPSGGPFGALNLIRFQRDTLGFLTDVAETHGDIAYFRMAAFHFYLVNSPAYVRELMTPSAQGGKVVKWGRQTATWSNAVGASTLTMEGESWKSHRRILNPSFQATVVKRYLDVVTRHTTRRLNAWQSGQEIEMMFEMMRTTMGIIADIIFSVGDIERDAADQNQALTAVFEVLTARTTAFQQMPLWMPTGDNRRIAKATEVIEAFILPMIAERRRSGAQYDDILGDLIAAKDEETGAQLSDREICNELKTLFGAGHETTALMLMWTLHLLANNPGIQQKLQEEADTVLGGRVPGLDDIKRMPYTEKVLNESMRVYPPAWSLMVRQAVDDIQLGGTTVPKGSVMLIPMWTIHRDARIYEDPLKFDPERFDGDWKKRYPPYAFFPFGGGPHVCVGSHLAMFEGQLMLPMMVQRFSYEPVEQPEIELQALLTLRPKGGLKIRVAERSRGL